MELRAAGFGSEGTKFYTASKDSYAVYEWDLDTAYEVGSGVTWSGKRFLYGPSPTGKRFHYGWQENNAYGVAFSTTGDNLYVAGQDNKVYQYKLGTNWDISSRRTGTGDTASATFSGTEGTDIYSVQFSKDGTKVYFVKDEDGIVQHTLSTAWDITSANTTMGTSAGLGTTAFSVNNGNTDDARAGISTLENNPRALAFSYDGSKMYFAGTSPRYNLSVHSDNSLGCYNCGCRNGCIWIHNFDLYWILGELAFIHRTQFGWNQVVYILRFTSKSLYADTFHSLRCWNSVHSGRFHHKLSRI